MINDSQKIVITLPSGYQLVAEQNNDPLFKNEIYIGILGPDGVWYQDLAIVRNGYKYSRNNRPVWEEDEFEVLVFGNENCEDYTEEFKIGLYKHGGI